jgi:phosphoribosylaminoimidazole-succinocarboxamide synthase
MVTSDRLSAFDVVMAEPIPQKGRVLTAMSAFWFEQMADIVRGHLISTDVADLPADVQAVADEADLPGRFMLTHKAEMLPIECIVRGYLSGSAWKEYRAYGTMHGTKLPEGLLESDRLPEPVFTPSTKADEGHDENISFDQAADLVGIELATKVRDVSLELYRRGADWARERGIIIADTKFELGMVDGELILCDEVLTPDSSRFWPVDAYQPGGTPPSFDKQPVRDYLETLDWDKKPPPRRCRPRSSAPPAPLRRGLRAHHRPAFADWPGGRVTLTSDRRLGRARASRGSGSVALASGGGRPCARVAQGRRARSWWWTCCGSPRGVGGRRPGAVVLPYVWAAGDARRAPTPPP